MPYWDHKGEDANCVFPFVVPIYPQSLRDSPRGALALFVRLLRQVGEQLIMSMWAATWAMNVVWDCEYSEIMCSFVDRYHGRKWR